MSHLRNFYRFYRMFFILICIYLWPWWFIVGLVSVKVQCFPALLVRRLKIHMITLLCIAIGFLPGHRKTIHPFPPDDPRHPRHQRTFKFVKSLRKWHQQKEQQKISIFYVRTLIWKLIFFQIFQLQVKNNEVIDYVMSKVKLSKYVFHAYHSKRNLTLISNQMSLIHSISIFSQIITFEIDEIIDTFMKSYLTPQQYMLDVQILLRYKVVKISNK